MTILGDQELFVKSQSQVHLKCVVSDAVETPPMYIEWLRNGRRIGPETRSGRDGRTRHRVQISPPEVITDDTAISILTILETEKTDSGTYSCWPAGMNNASMSLHVVDSELSTALLSFSVHSLDISSGESSARAIHTLLGKRRFSVNAGSFFSKLHTKRALTLWMRHKRRKTRKEWRGGGVLARWLKSESVNIENRLEQSI